jgi:hypothetical protein
MGFSVEDATEFFFHRPNFICQLRYSPITSAQLAVNLSQMRSSHASCSGFISTERRHVTSSAPSAAILLQFRCRRLKPCLRQLHQRQMQIPRCAGGSKSSAPARKHSFRRLGVHLPHHNVELRRSGCKRLEASGLILPQPPVQFQGRRPAAASPRANSPPGTSGKSCCVAHKATAAAPAREHSRLISPRCNCFEVK